MTATYTLHQTRKSYGRAFTLTLDRLEITAGETLCLLGPTGSGKSTLLRLLAGLEEPDGGQIHFAEHTLPLIQLPLDVQRRVTLVHQRPRLLSTSVRSNVAFGLRLRGQRNGSGRVEQLLQQFGLSELASQPATTLSGGQTQLVALARAVAFRPDVLLLDEPTANLDPAHVALVERLLVDYQRQQRATVVWATHNLFQARRLADRVGLLLQGALVELAPREPFFERPRDARTREFLEGKMVY